jgi:LytS/YehU family sensor histidine kinase
MESKENNTLLHAVRYEKDNTLISISYDVRDDNLQVIIYKLRHGMMPDYDDKTRTIHLNSLNTKLLPMIEKDAFLENNSYVQEFSATNDSEHKLLKLTKELRLCLLILLYSKEARF